MADKGEKSSGVEMLVVGERERPVFNLAARLWRIRIALQSEIARNCTPFVLLTWNLASSIHPYFLWAKYFAKVTALLLCVTIQSIPFVALNTALRIYK